MGGETFAMQVVTNTLQFVDDQLIDKIMEVALQQVACKYIYASFKINNYSNYFLKKVSLLPIDRNHVECGLLSKFLFQICL